MTDAEVLALRLCRVRERIAAACARAGRPGDSVELMAVSKQHSAESLAAVAALGVRLFGENRVQEFASKRAGLAGCLPDGVRVEMIGQLQTNKARLAVEVFDGLHSLDSLRLARRVNEAALAAGKRFSVWLEVKLSGESTKTGFAPDSSELAQLLEEIPSMTALEPRGLMTVPEWSADPEAPRPVFQRLRKVRDEFSKRFPHVPLPGLSMGMSHDFETAIAEGATVIRVGTDIFGPRKRPA